MNPGESRGIHPDGEMFFTPSNAQEESPVIGPLRISKRDSASPTSAPSPPNVPLPYPDDRPRPQGRTSSSSDTRPADPHRYGSPPAAAGSVSPADYPAALRPHEGRAPRAATLAERRGAAPRPLPESPADVPDRETLAARPYPAPPAPASNATTSNAGHYDYRQQYYPPPQSSTPRPSATPRPSSTLQAPQASSGGLNRISSTASTSTTRAQRGSPPPPETPVVGPGQQPGSDIEARYAAAGIAGTGTLAGMQSQSAAAQSRAEQYSGQQPVQRPWTPTEQPGSQPHGPPTVYQGAEVVSGPGAPVHPAPVHPAYSSPPPPQSQPQPAQLQPQQQPQRIQPNALENDMDRMRISEEPPPAYSSVSGSASGNHYPNEKQTGAAAATAAAAVGHPQAANQDQPGSSNSPAPTVSDHPAFANDPPQQRPQNGYTLSDGPVHEQPAPQQAAQVTVTSPGPSQAPPASPPPLPEGWIAHLDPSSGQYYYIHLPTQSTQWEFPKGPTPLNLNEVPMSPVGSVYSSHPMASPGLSVFNKPLASPGVPLTPGFESLASPMGGFTGPPPSSGVELYKTAPTNGVYFGPYLRYTNMDIDRGTWHGSILLVTDAAQPPTIHMHQSVDLSPNPRQLKAVNIAAHQRWTFYRYEIDIQMDDAPAKWTYAITSHLGCTRYEFLVAGRHETNWRFIATSGNDFSINVNANERSRLGGVGFMWKDIMQKHNEIGGFHAQLSLGGQIYADRMWKEIPCLKQWLTIRGKEARKDAPWTAANQQDVSHAYFHYYTSHFDQPYLREAFAQIPYICQIDDHDMYVPSFYLCRPILTWTQLRRLWILP